jgi:serine/threonine-protein kinase
MELLEGEDLARRLERRGRFGLRETARILTQIGKALALAHQAGIVHRDLKPRNVFLARVGDEEIAKVCDFGIAKELDAPRSNDDTVTGTVIGSPEHMSPEQARGGTVDARSDLWSLGVMLYRMITGARLFEGKNLGDVIVRICTDPILPPSTMVDDLPLGMDAFFERALQREPEARFPSIQAMVHAFAGIAEVSEDDADLGLPDPAPETEGERTGPPGATRSYAGLGRSAETAPLSGTLGTLGATTAEADRDALTSPERRPARRSGTRARLYLGGLALAGSAIGAWFIVRSPTAPSVASAPSSSAPAPSAPAAPVTPDQPPPAQSAVSVPAEAASEAAPPRVAPAPSPPKTSKPETPKPRATSGTKYDPFSGLPLAPGRR